LTPLEDLLQQCTVKITVPGGWGTGFFVAPGLILTCAHVVRKAADLQVTVSSPVWQQPLSAIMKAKADDGKTLDLALVELFEPLPDHPCVLLDEEPVAVGQALYSYGYLESYTNAAPVRPINEGLTGDTPPLLKLQGAQIEKGISGAALLNLKTGKVCGMVKETRAAGFDLGGGAIPTRVILEQFPELRSLQQSFHGGVGAACPSDNRRWINLITPPGIYFQPYRKAVIDHYSQQCHLYTPTDALLPLEARSVERQAQDEGQKQQPEKMGEPFPVLDGLRKYALGTKREHVLLAGRPGSGKSTTLRQLAMSLAQEGQVPVLIQLKGDRPVPDLIQAEFRRRKQPVTSEQIDEWLLDDRLVLLLDGVNEIPNDDLRRKLAQFRDDNLTVPMIFTTRALLGDDLGINKRLEMKPLSPTQMREFVGKYLQEQGDRLLEQLRDRLRELAETPLLLKLLCDVFDPETNQIPQSRGELFQWFDRDYRRIKKEIEYVPVSENFWEFKSEILQYLAFSMIQGEMQTADLQKPHEPWLTIHKSRAEGILETWFHQRGILDAPTKAKKWLQDLCNYHLLQDAAKTEEIEFHHQLFQEYYAAEYLLKVLPTLTDDQLKRDYLNYLKWTEALVLMLSLEDKEAQILRVVQLALDVDLMLGVRLAREVRNHKTSLAINDILNTRKINPKVLELTKRKWTQEQSQEFFIEHFSIENGSDHNERYESLKTLRDINSNFEECERAILYLCNYKDDSEVIQELSSILENQKYCAYLQSLAVRTLAILGCQVPYRQIQGILVNHDYSVKACVVEAIGIMKLKEAIPILINYLSTEGYIVNSAVIPSLLKIGEPSVYPEVNKYLIELDESYQEKDDFEKFQIDNRFLGYLLRDLEEKPSLVYDFLIPFIPGILRHENLVESFGQVSCANPAHREEMWISSVESLANIKYQPAINVILSMLHSKDECSIEALQVVEKLHLREAVDDLITLLSDPNSASPEIARILSLFEIESTLSVLSKVRDNAFSTSPLEEIASYQNQSFIERVQNKCRFYNYDVFQAHRVVQNADRQTHPNSDPNAITIQTLGSLTIMADQAPIFNQQHATIGVNYAAEGSKVEFTQHASSSTQTFEILLSDYQQFIQQLQQKYPTLADATTIPQIIEVEAKLIEAQDQQRWQNFISLKRLWNGSKKAGIKVGEHFAENNVWAIGAIAFLEGVSEDEN
jgi:HEAT repeat protein/energy-coupling factor transporter ATP-binding protein EcfA2